MNSIAIGPGRATKPTSLRSVFAGLLLLSLLPLAGATVASEPDAEQLADGKQLATTRSKGNCLACHAFDGGQLPGNLGPPLIAMKARFPDPTVLKAQIWDATERNPETVMPPFGRHRILSEQEIDLIVDYLYTL